LKFVSTTTGLYHICEANQKRKMRTMKYLLSVFTFLLLFASQLEAQRGNWGRSPEERAEQQSNMMRDSLALSDAQYEKVKEVNLEYAKKFDEMRNNAEGDWSAMREQMGALRQEQNEALKALLTTEQYEKWQKIQEAMRQRRGNRGRGGGRG